MVRLDKMWREQQSQGDAMLCTCSHGFADVALAPSETYYHVIEPGESTIYNLTIDNPTPGPSDLVADTFRLTVENVNELERHLVLRIQPHSNFRVDPHPPEGQFRWPKPRAITPEGQGPDNIPSSKEINLLKLMYEQFLTRILRSMTIDNLSY